MDTASLIKEYNSSRFVSNIDKNTLHLKINSSNSVVKIEGNNLIGFGYFTHINREWCELGPIFIVKSKRGKGLGKQIFTNLMKKALTDHKKVLVITRNPTLKNILVNYGFSRPNSFEIPAYVFWRLLQKRSLSNYYSMFKKGILFSGWEQYIYVKK